MHVKALKGFRTRITLFFLLVSLLAICLVGFLNSRNPLENVSTVEAIGSIGVYWDKNCSKPVYSIDWGALLPGQTEKLTLYVRNEGNESGVLEETSINWNPTSASTYMTFSMQPCELDVGNVATVTQTLVVSRYIKGISAFAFDVVFEMGKYFLGDVNKDGVVDGKDVALVSASYGTTPKDAKWNPNADLNNDGVIDGADVAIVARDYGKRLQQFNS